VTLQFPDMKPQEIVTLSIAVVGLLLSTRNAWRDHRRDKVRIRVIPKISYPIGPMPDPRPCFGFEIINNGVFPVTIDDVGFLFAGTKKRGSISAPILHDKGEWPRRLEPHSAVTLYSAAVPDAGFEIRTSAPSSPLPADVSFVGTPKR
jgi:hypothetical protein